MQNKASKTINKARIFYKESSDNSNEAISNHVNRPLEEINSLLSFKKMNLVRSYTQPYLFFLFNNNLEKKITTEKDCKTVINSINFNILEKKYLRTFGFILTSEFDRKSIGVKLNRK